MKINKDTVCSFFIYVLSAGGMVLADFIIVSSYNQDTISQWAFFKSVIFILGGLCIFGFDQLLLREVQYYIKLKRQFFLQSFILAFVSSIFLYFYLHDFLKSVLCLIMIWLYSVFLFESAYFRANSDLALSQLYTNLWKIILFTIVVFFVFLEIKIDILKVYFLSILISFALLYLLRFFLLSTKPIYDLKINRKDRLGFFILGFYFFIHNISLVMANYGEQFLINLFDQSGLSSIIFTYITLYSSLTLVITGFIGFYLGPKVRNNKNFNIKNYYHLFNILFALSLFSLFITFVLIALLKYFFFLDFVFDPILWVMTMLMTLFRVLYILPSLCLGVFGEEKILMRSSCYTMFVVILYIVVLLILLLGDFQNLAYVVMFIMIMHWFLKLVISNYFVCLSLNKLKREF